MNQQLVPVDRQAGALSTTFDPNSINFEALLKVGAMLAKSGFFPDAKGEAQAVAKVIAGAELGIGPVASLRGIDLIEGKLAPNAGLIAALVKRAYPRYDYRVVESTAERCELAFYTHGSLAGPSIFSLADARTAGLAGKSTWTKYPTDMLFARALTRGARRYCPDLFIGAIYTPEELGGDTPPEAPARSAPVTSDDHEAQSTWQDRPATEPQIKAIYAIARGTQAMDDGTLEAWCRSRFGAPPNELSRLQAADAIDAMKLGVVMRGDAPMPVGDAIDPKHPADAAQARYLDMAKRLGYTTGRQQRDALGIGDQPGGVKAQADKLGWDELRKLLEDRRTVQDYYAEKRKPAAAEAESNEPDEDYEPEPAYVSGDSAFDAYAPSEQPTLMDTPAQHGDPVDAPRGRRA